MRRAWLIAAAVGLMVVTSCDLIKQGFPWLGTPYETVNADLGTPFRLRFDQKARVEEAGLTIRFADVTEDSRCPATVQCIWAGQAKMVFEVIQEQGGAELRTVTLSGNRAQPVRIGSYVLTVSALQPDTQVGTRIEKARYIATLTIRRDR
jgi:hypothetical protein